MELIRYGLLQSTIGPSIFCDLLVFIFFIRNWRKELLAASHNHVILCLLVVSFVQKISDVPFYLYYLRWNIVVYQSDTFCMIWNWLDYSSVTVASYLLAWCCVERHLFAFHRPMMRKQGRLLLFHYIPILICLCSTPLFYLVVIFFPTSCANSWDYSSIFCGGACYSSVPFLGAFDWLLNYATPIIVIVLANITLFILISWKNMAERRPVRWRHQRRLIYQLVLISALFLVFSAPQVVVGVIQALIEPTFLRDVQFNYLYYLAYFSNQFLPFVIVGSLPRTRRKFQEWVYRKVVRFLRNHSTRTYPMEASRTIAVNPVYMARSPARHLL